MKNKLQAWVLLATLLAALAMPGIAQTNANKPNEIVFPVKIVDGPPKSAEDIAADKASQKREADDLVAQQSVATSTLAIVGLSIGQFVVTVIGTVVVLYTIKLSRTATKAAVKAVDATLNVGRDQSRAYVHLDRAEYKSGQKPNGLGPSITLFVKNTGETPAEWFELQYTIWKAPVDTPAIRFAEIEFETPGSVYHPLGGGVEVPVSVLMIRVRQDIDDSYRNNVNGDIGLFVAGTIKYHTFFDELFITQFVYELRGLPRYSEINIGENQQGPIGEERSHEMRHSSGRVLAFERIEEPV